MPSCAALGETSLIGPVWALKRMVSCHWWFKLDKSHQASEDRLPEICLIRRRGANAGGGRRCGSHRSSPGSWGRPRPPRNRCCRTVTWTITLLYITRCRGSIATRVEPTKQLSEMTWFINKKIKVKLLSLPGYLSSQREVAEIDRCRHYF